MDDPTSRMVSHLCGLNAQGSGPRRVLVHIIKSHEGGGGHSEAAARPRAQKGHVSQLALQLHIFVRKIRVYNMFFFPPSVFEMINISFGPREKNQSSPVGLRRCLRLSVWAVGERAEFCTCTGSYLCVCVFTWCASLFRKAVYLHTPCQVQKATA